jgi:hypothetical protein
MRWMRAGLPLVAVALLAGCARTTHAAPRTTENPWAAPKPSAPPTPSQEHSPPAVFQPTSPAPSPTQKKATTCGEIPLSEGWYWREEAVPPATCAQARSVLPAAVKSKYFASESFTVSGWHCGWTKVAPYGQVDGHVVCAKGLRTVRAVYLHRR